jgi:hypothetical protein
MLLRKKIDYKRVWGGGGPPKKRRYLMAMCGPLLKLRTPCTDKAEEGDSLNYCGIEQKGKKKPQGQNHQFLCGIQV